MDHNIIIKTWKFLMVFPLYPSRSSPSPHSCCHYIHKYSCLLSQPSPNHFPLTECPYGVGSFRDIQAISSPGVLSTAGGSYEHRSDVSSTSTSAVSSSLCLWIFRWCRQTAFQTFPTLPQFHTSLLIFQHIGKRWPIHFKWSPFTNYSKIQNPSIPFSNF